ncbi:MULTISPECIES: IS110 family transposase [Streptomyces]|uniref:IS110 family transposase n=1 Tax=Streptomyces TaxID=1883 RepID=UPI00131EAF1E
MGRWWAGIDWSTGLQDFAIIDAEGRAVTHLRVEESREGVAGILRALRALNPTSHRFSRRQVPVAIQDGSRLIAAKLRRQRQAVVAIPPTVAARHRGWHSAVASKSDRSDAVLLGRHHPSEPRATPSAARHLRPCCGGRRTRPRPRGQRRGRPPDHAPPALACREWASVSTRGAR